MKKAGKTGISWRPVEYILIASVVVLTLLLVWAVREIDSQEVSETTEQMATKENDDISQITQEALAAEQAVDEAYDEWERANGSVLDSAADNIGGVIDESSY